MQDLIKWEDNFLSIEDCYQLISYIGDSKFKLSDIHGSWYVKFSASFKHGPNTLLLLCLLDILINDKSYYYLNPQIKIKNLTELKTIIAEKIFNNANQYVLESIPFDKLFFDINQQHYYFARNSTSLSWSGLINFLASLNILSMIDKHYLSIQDPRLESLIINQRKRASRSIQAITPDSLKTLLDRQSMLGSVSEQYAMRYEVTRLKNLNIKSLPKQISLLDATQGFDILSFQSLQSKDYDRFIEVKTFNNSYFYMSHNERQIAQSLGDKYYLYLVKHLDDNQKFAIKEICNPCLRFKQESKWATQAVDFKITSKREFNNI